MIQNVEPGASAPGKIQIETPDQAEKRMKLELDLRDKTLHQDCKKCPDCLTHDIRHGICEKGHIHHIHFNDLQTFTFCGYDGTKVIEFNPKE